MDIQTLLEKFNIKPDCDPLKVKIPVERWESLVIRTYLQMKLDYENGLADLLALLEMKEVEMIDHQYGKFFAGSFDDKDILVSSREQTDKVLAVKACLYQLPNRFDIQLTDVTITEQKTGLFARKTYGCLLKYRHVRIPDQEVIAKKIAGLFRNSLAVDPLKELKYLQCADLSDADVILELGKCTALEKEIRDTYLKKAKDLYAQKASKGWPKALGIYAELLLEEKPRAAFRFAKAAADAGEGKGYVVLGRYCQLHPDTRDYDYFMQAAELDDTDGLYEWGRSLRFRSRPETEKHSQGVQYIKKAAERGHINALYELGQIYLEGEDLPRHTNLAYRCFLSSANLGKMDAVYELGICYLEGIGTVKKIDEAVRCMKQAADYGLADAQFQLAKMYAQGLGVKLDSELAYLYYSMAANHGHAEAIYWAGVCEEEGRGTDQNMETAMKRYMQAADLQNENALKKISLFFMGHIGSRETQQKAFLYISQLAERGNNVALAQLGQAYWQGHIVVADKQKAFQYYLKAADQGYQEAQYRVGLCYTNGEGTRKNVIKAYHYLNLAAEQGHSQAILACYDIQKSMQAANKDKEIATQIIELHERQQYEEIFSLIETYGADIADHELLLEIITAYIEYLLENTVDLNSEEPLFDEILQLAEKHASLNIDDCFYETALLFESENQMLHAICAYVFSAMGGSKKALETLRNMSFDGSRYFISLDKTYL